MESLSEPKLRKSSFLFLSFVLGGAVLQKYCTFNTNSEKGKIFETSGFYPTPNFPDFL